MVVVWVLLGLACLAIEVSATTAFFALFLAVGFAGGALADVVGLPLVLQCVVIAGVDVAGIVVARPPLLHHLAVRGNARIGGVSGIVGQAARTLDTVGDEHHPGHAQLAGERWLAISATGEPLSPDQPVVVADVRGTTLVVFPAIANQAPAAPTHP